jgi:pimeloyl-ACP methyl ester carboxylesterase
MASIEEPAGHQTTVTSKDGTQIACWLSGGGPPLVLVHGTSADHVRWQPVLPAFQEHFTVCAVDRRGRGGSGDSDSYSIEREFEDVATVVDSFDETVNLLGHSYGGLCALEASLLTKNLRRLVLYEPPAVPAGVYPPGFIERLEALIDRGKREEALVAFMTEVVKLREPEVELMRALPAWEGRIAAAHTLPREARVDESYKLDPIRLASMSVPTLILQGGESPSFLTLSNQSVHAALPNSRIAVMPGQQHVAMDTATDLFVAEVLSFLLET